MPLRKRPIDLFEQQRKDLHDAAAPGEAPPPAAGLQRLRRLLRHLEPPGNRESEIDPSDPRLRGSGAFHLDHGGRPEDTHGKTIGR